MKNVLIGIAGGTASGKTTIARAIEVAFSEDEVVIVRMDNYYKSQDHLSMDDRVKTDYDHPDAFDMDLLREQLQDLIDNKSIEHPIYDFTIHTRSSKKQKMNPCQVIILEGILVLTEPKIVDLMDIKVFVDTEADLRFIRRLLRDTTERERSIHQSIAQYLDTAKPGHDQFVEPSKKRADIIVPYVEHNTVAVKMLIDQISYLAFVKK